MSSAHVPHRSFLGGASGALITGLVAFRPERSRMTASAQARWERRSRGRRRVPPAREQ